MRIRIIERYSICRCTYYSHAADSCPSYGQPNHLVQNREVLVGFTCSRHASSAVDSRPRTTNRRNIFNTRSTWEEDDPGELVFSGGDARHPKTSESELIETRCEARHPKTGERCTNYVTPPGNPKHHQRASGRIFIDKLESTCPCRLPARAEEVGSASPVVVRTAEGTTQDGSSIALRDLGEPQPETAPIPQNKHCKSIRPCHILIFLGALTIVGSLTSALWRAVEFDDLSGGFTLAQYILGVGVFVTGSMTAIHSKTCTCWRQWGALSETTAALGSNDSP